MPDLNVKAVIFDMDGVLVDSGDAVEGNWRLFARRYGVDEEVLLSDVHGYRTVDTMRRHLAAERVEEAIAWFHAMESQKDDRVRLLPGAADALAALHGTPWAIVSSGTRSVVRARLESAGLSRPEVLVAGEDVTAGKPDPQGFLRALDLLGCPAAETVVFEDSPAGIKAARTAGIPTIGLTTTYGPSRLNADDTVADLSGVVFRAETETIIISF